MRALERAGLALSIVSMPCAWLVLAIADLRHVHTYAVGVAALGWFLASLLIAIPYCRRFGGGLADCFRVGSALGFVHALPLFPFLSSGVSQHGGGAGLTLWILLVHHIVVARGLRAQGRYAGTDRELPELGGELRAAGETVLEKAGLRPLSFRVAPLGSYNAMVQGLRTCVVVVDRRASESFTPSEFAALVAHEAGHVRYGGMLTYVAIVPASLFLVNVLSVLRWVEDGELYLLLPLIFLLRSAVSQGLEVRCDAFAGRLTGATHVVNMLAKVHADMPVALARWTRRRVYIPFTTHPPLDVRLAFLGQGDPRRRAHYVWTWTFTLLGLFFGPLGVLVGAGAAGVKLPEPVSFTLRGLPALYAVGWCLFRVVEIRIGMRSSGLERRSGRRGRAIAWVALLLWLALGLLFVTVGSVGGPDWLGAWLGWAVVLTVPVMLVLVLLCRSGFPPIRRRVRRALLEANVAFEEGRTGDALAIANAALVRSPRHRWLLLLRGSSLVALGRFEDAIESLSVPLERRDTRPFAALNLCVAELLRGNAERARDMACNLAREAPADADVLQIWALAAHEAGRLDEADETYARASALREKDARALAGRALVALERSGWDGDAEKWLDAARAHEPSSTWVLLASAAARQARGETAAAAAELRLATQELRRKGLLGWIPHYERVGRSRGIDGGEDPVAASGSG